MFVPTPASPPQPPSPRARELGEQIALFVRDYTAQNPDVEATDVQAAFQVARGHLSEYFGDARWAKTMMILALGLGVLVLFGVLGFRQTSNPSVLAIVVGLAIAMIGMMLLATARRGR